MLRIFPVDVGADDVRKGRRRKILAAMLENMNVVDRRSAKSIDDPPVTFSGLDIAFPKWRHDCDFGGRGRRRAQTTWRRFQFISEIAAPKDLEGATDGAVDDFTAVTFESGSRFQIRLSHF